jgi:oligoribonuclease (3'-5' exoribonuclease)
MNPLLFLDFETTGLDPTKHLPLEVGVFCDSSGVQTEAHWLLAVDVNEALAQADEFVQNMHAESGLWDDLLAPPADEPLIERAALEGTLCAWWAQYAREAAPKGRKPWIAGWNPAFDLGWLRVHAPSFAAVCDYHTFDLSTLKQTCRAVYPGEVGPTLDARGRHRALSDCRSAVAYWRWYRSHVMSPYGRNAGGGA